MRIGFISGWDPENINCWSGTLYYIFNSLKKQNEIKWIGERAISQAYRLHFLKYDNHIPFHPECYSDFIGYYITHYENLDNFDLLLIKDSYFVSNINTQTPMVYIGDATFRLIEPIYTIFHKENFGILDNIENLALQNMDRIILSSNWAKNATSETYGIKKSKIDVIEFGANINVKFKRANLKRPPITERCNLLFIGKSANGKGLYEAYETYNVLREKGINCTITIIGCTADFIDTADSNVKVFLIDKSKKQDQKRLHEILLYSHIHILPTKFDCFGIVFCETSAYGIPSLTTDVGGVSQVVKSRKNGYLLPPDSKGIDYANIVEKICKDENLYNQLQKTSIREYEKRLNWNVWLIKIQTILENVVYKDKSVSKYDFYIPTYILGNKMDIDSQFINKKEFHIKDRVNEDWSAFVKIIQRAIFENDDVIIVCKSIHKFTNDYSKDYFMKTLISAAARKVQVLLGNTNFHSDTWYIGENKDFVINFDSSNFMVIYKSIFRKIVEYNNTGETIENSLINLTKCIASFNPSISQMYY